MDAHHPEYGRSPPSPGATGDSDLDDRGREFGSGAYTSYAYEDPADRDKRLLQNSSKKLRQLVSENTPRRNERRNARRVGAHDEEDAASPGHARTRLAPPITHTNDVLLRINQLTRANNQAAAHQATQQPSRVQPREPDSYYNNYASDQSRRVLEQQQYPQYHQPLQNQSVQQHQSLHHELGRSLGGTEPRLQSQDDVPRLTSPLPRFVPPRREFRSFDGLSGPNPLEPEPLLRPSPNLDAPEEARYAFPPNNGPRRHQRNQQPGLIPPRASSSRVQKAPKPQLVTPVGHRLAAATTQALYPGSEPIMRSGPVLPAAQPAPRHGVRPTPHDLATTEPAAWIEPDPQADLRPRKPYLNPLDDDARTEPLQTGHTSHTSQLRTGPLRSDPTRTDSLRADLTTGHLRLDPRTEPLQTESLRTDNLPENFSRGGQARSVQDTQASAVRRRRPGDWTAEQWATLDQTLEPFLADQGSQSPEALIEDVFQRLPTSLQSQLTRETLVKRATILIEHKVSRYRKVLDTLAGYNKK